MKEGASSSSPQPRSSLPSWNYDVFLSFNSRDDSCRDFARNLYGNLWEKGIRTFLGDETIEQDAAKEISDSTENYASSRFCLERLVQALDCVKGNGRFIWPVFYHVDPSDVRCQTKSYKIAFDHHEGAYHSNLVKRWRWALTCASTLSGWCLDPSDEPPVDMEVIIQQVYWSIFIHPSHTVEATMNNGESSLPSSSFGQKSKGTSSSSLHYYDEGKFDGGDCFRNFARDLCDALYTNAIQTFHAGWEHIIPIRLWFHKTLFMPWKMIYMVNLEAIMLDCADDVEEVHWNMKAFRKIKILRLLSINNELFHWTDYPSTTLRSIKVLQMLRYLILERIDMLKELPDLSGASNLQKLSVLGCKNLIKIDISGVHHANLKELRARGCTKLTSFLEDGINFLSLEILDLTGCSNFQKFPEILGKMEKMKTLALSGTAIETLPESIENLAGLECLYLYNCRRLGHLPMHSICNLTKLVRLEAGSCGIFNLFKGHEALGTVNLSFWNISRLHLNKNNISDQLLARILGRFPRLQVLELRDNDFTIVPSCIEECCHLRRLYLDGCKQLQEIRGIPPNIRVLSVINCTLLTSVFSRGLFKQILQEPWNRKFILPGGWVPEWMHCYNKGSSVSLRVRNKLPAIAVYVVFDVKGRGSCRFEFEIRVLINGTNRIVLKKDVLDIECGHIYMFDDLRLQSQEFGLNGKKFNHVQISCSADYKNKSSSDAFGYVNYIGVYVYNFASCAHDIRFENPKRTLDEDDSFSIYSDDSRKDRLYYAEDFFEGSGAIEDSY